MSMDTALPARRLLGIPQPAHGPDPAPCAAAPEPRSPGGTAPGLESQQLFRGRSVVPIQHNGATYLLRATKLGKLILTK